MTTEQEKTEETKLVVPHPYKHPNRFEEPEPEVKNEDQVEKNPLAEETSFLKRKANGEDTSNEDQGTDVDWKSRYDNLRSWSNKKITEMQVSEEQVKKQLQKDLNLQDPLTQEQLDEILKKNPDLYKFVETIADNRATVRSKEMEDELEDVRKNFKKTLRDKAELQILAEHKDWNELKVDSNFNDWVEQRPKETQDSVYEQNTNPQPVIDLLNYYKLEKGFSTVHRSSNRDEEKDLARFVDTKDSPSPGKGNKKIWTESEVAALSSKDKYWFEKNHDEIMLARQEGRYDTTK
jgi:hypothetical protein